MKRTMTLCAAAAVVLLLPLAIDAQQKEPRATRAPMLTSEDVVSPRSAPPSEESISNSSGSPIPNARAVLESALTKMGEVSSLRTRMEASLPTGVREVLVESVRPGRMHIVSAEGEMIQIGGKFYLKSNGEWQVTSMPASGAQSDSGFDFRTLVKQMIGKSGLRITGQLLGDQLLDGVDTAVYEFAVTDGSQTGTIQVSVGKKDGYMRRMSLSGGGLGIKLWFTNINEPLSIEPPM